MPFFGVPLRNGVPIGLGSVAGFGISPFDPSQLFASGEQGAWYDPSDFSTMFQDSAGTTPVTAVEQPVGLLLDKSKGLTLGAELVTNGDFSSGSTGWTLVSSSVVGGALNCSAVISTQFATRSITVVAGRTYQVSFTVTNYTSGNIFLTLGVGANVSTASVGANGVFTSFLVAGAGNAEIRMGSPGTGFVGTLDNISVKQLSGNHASQATTTSRPVLSARVNLLTYTEQFNNAAWAKTRSTITANAVTAPDGSLTADKLVEDTSASLSHFIGQQATYVNATTYVYSVYARAGERNWLCFNLPSALMTTSKVAYFDLTNGVTGTVDSGLTASISAVGNNWYRCSISFTATASVTASILLVLATANGTLNYTGDGTSGIYIWGADLRVTNVGVNLPAYQRVAAATDYDTSGFPLYLKFDGVDDSLATGTIDFSATDKMSVFAGVRKLSDASGGLIAELGNNSAGGWYLYPGSWVSAAGAFYTFLSRGTAADAFGQAVQAGTYTAPITNVLAATGNISSDLNTLRVNSVAGTNATADQGTGNYGNLALNIGRRNNASLPYNGNLYSLIVHGALSTDAQIASTETWVNGKTGACYD